MNKKLVLIIFSLILTIGIVYADSESESGDKIVQNRGNFFQRLFNNNNNDRYNRYDSDRYDSNRNYNRNYRHRNNNNSNRYDNQKRDYRYNNQRYGN